MDKDDANTKESFVAAVEEQRSKLTDPVQLKYLDLILTVGVPWIEALEELSDKDIDAQIDNTQIFLNAASRLLAWMASGVVHRVFKDSSHEEMLKDFLQVVCEKSERQLQMLELANQMSRERSPIKGIHEGSDTLQ